MKRQTKQNLKLERGSLEDRLNAAIKVKKVSESYTSFVKRRTGESANSYLERVKEDSEEVQFVRVDLGKKVYFVAFGVSGPIITRLGKFLLVPAQVVGGMWGVHHILVYPDLEMVKKQDSVLTIIKSGCFSGIVCNDNTCDCKEQFFAAQKECIERGSGIIIEILEQDGRGWGPKKMAVQRIMDELKIDTIKAATLFYGDKKIIDRRSYIEAGLIIAALGLKDCVIELASANPSKLKDMSLAGLKIIPAKGISGKNISGVARKNLAAKKERWAKLSKIEKEE